MQANGAGAAGLLLLAFTGILLWWPGLRLWTRGLRVKRTANWRRINFDLHHAIGFWTLAIVVWWAISGVYFGWYKPVTAAVAAISPLQGMISPHPTIPPLVANTPHASLAQIIQAAQSASPGARLWSISDPTLKTPDTYLLLDRAAPGDFSHRDILRIRTADARVLTLWHYGQNHSPGDWFLWLMHPAHFGTVWGTPIKILWALLGVALAALTATGVLMYWNRYLRRLLP